MRVIVTGVPGSGKTTLATALADALGFRFLGKDTIKAALWDALGPGDIEWSAQLGAASIVALRSLAAATPDLVLDLPVLSDFVSEWQALPDLVEVHCVCDPEVARERYRTRVRHECHFDHLRIADYDMWLADDAKRAPLGPRLDIDTSKDVDLAPIIAWLRGR